MECVPSVFRGLSEKRQRRAAEEFKCRVACIACAWPARNQTDPFCARSATWSRIECHSVSRARADMTI